MSSPTRPTLYLIDGYALIYRAFFAMISRPLRTSRGENTSAAWGVVNFLLRLRTKYHPNFAVWVLDQGRSFRGSLYPNYKSTREKLGAELQQDFDRAVEHTRELLAAFRLPIVAVDGYEADDVIGTLARRHADALDVVIVSGDKDFYQLIGPHVALLNPGRGGPAGVEEHWVDETNAGERLGVPPTQVIDYLALVGDASDNVPGVKGIGEKTAVQLLQEYRDLDEVLAHASAVKAKRAREALLAEPDQARLSRDLVTIRTDVPVEFDLAAAEVREPDADALLRVVTQLEFHSLIGRLPSPAKTAETPASAPPPASAVTIVDDPAAIGSLVERLRATPLVGIAVRSGAGGPQDAPLVGLALAASPEAVWYLPFGHRPPEGELAAPADVRNLPDLASPALRPLADWLGEAAVAKAGHDLKYAWQVLRRAGVELRGAAFDSMLASFLLDPGRRSHGLETLCPDLLGRPMAGAATPAQAAAEVPVVAAAAGTGGEAGTVMELVAYCQPRLAETSLAPLMAEIEMPLVEVLVEMEWQGIAIDRAVFERLSRELTGDLVRLEAEIAKAAGGSVNLNSPKQLAAVLFERLQLPVLKRTKTGPSTDADVLAQLAEMGHDVPRLLLDYRELQKLKSTYVDVLPGRVNPRTGRIHTSFNQTGAATGRLSSSDPNLQNIPVRSPRGEAIRRGFVPTAGWKFIVADYSQIELRLMAHLSGDPAFVDAFARGDDIHRQTAAIIFGVEPGAVSAEMRNRAKTINFGTIYGQGPFALSRQLGIPQEEAKRFITEYFDRFSGVRRYLDQQVELARAQGFVETIFKRRRYIPEVKDKNFNTRAFGERLSQNSPLQGSAADLIKLAMVRLFQALRGEGLATRLLLQVHDELVLEAPPEEVDRGVALVKSHMEGVTTLRVPLVVEVGVGDNWLDAKH